MVAIGESGSLLGWPINPLAISSDAFDLPNEALSAVGVTTGRGVATPRRLGGRRTWLLAGLGVLTAYELMRACVAILVSRPAARSLIGFDPHAAINSLWAPPFLHFALSPLLPVLAAVLLLQRLVPGHREERGPELSNGVAEDLAWLVIGVTLTVPLVALVGTVLEPVLETHLRFLTIGAVAALPAPLPVVIAIVVSDLVAWATHIARHHVRCLWRVHAVHHAQRRLNPFTQLRSHPVESMLLKVLTLIALFAVGAEPVTAAGVFLALSIHSMVEHSNLRTDFGPLRYVLVSPQSHRVHHSIDPAHFGKNFGDHLSVWDHLFGTQYRGYDEYPDTGIADGGFPRLDTVSLRAVVRCWAAQLAYPFRRANEVG